MALSIAEPCVGCWACVDVCPNGAVKVADGVFCIDARLCTECDGDFVDPQCAAICPVEAAILDREGMAINPPGSLTGIPPERLLALENADGISRLLRETGLHQ